MIEVDPNDYHSKLTCNRENIFADDSWLSKSAISEFASGSPYVWRYHPRQYESKAMAHGTLIDTLVTTPELFKEMYVVTPYPLEREEKVKGEMVMKTISTATNEAKDWAKKQTKTIITQDQKDQAEQAAEMLLKKHTISASIFANSKKQVILKMTKEEWEDAGQDWIEVNLKCLLDLVPDGDFLADLKTCHDLSLRGIERAIASFDYHAQAGMYLTLWNMLNPDDQRNRFKFIFQSSKPPFEVAVVELSLMEINNGKAYIRKHLNELQRCANLNRWPMIFGEKQIVVSRPTWAMMEDEENE